MLNGLMQKLERFSNWQLIVLFVLMAEVLSAIMNAFLSRMLWGKVSLDLIMIGSIDAFIVSVIVSAVGIYLIRKTVELTITNERLREEIKARELAEARLRESEQKYRQIYENSLDLIFQADLSGNIVDVNPVIEKYGYTKEEIIGKPVIDYYVNPEDRARLLEQLHKKGEVIDFETCLKKKDGTLVYASVNVYHIVDESGNATGIEGSLRDITDRRRAEEQMMKTEKLESLGILAGGIAHDFNNVLTAILGNISLAKVKMKADETHRKWLEEAERASYHAKELTQQLLTFAKGGTPIKHTVALEPFIRNTLGFSMRGSNVRSDLRFAEGLWPVDIDEGQMAQVFKNLVINACQAMPGGGVITITSRNVDIGPKDGLPLSEGKYVKTSVEDQGMGIPLEDLQRIFEPYFTTKQKGSGLGLSIVYSVMKNHHGTITVKSQPGTGTTFSLYLPASSARVFAKQPEAKEHLQGRGRILVMDDEEIVRKVAGEILKDMGYEVTFAMDGSEAIQLYEAAMGSSLRFDAVIMDLTIPGGMGGKEAIQRIREADPDVRAIVASGYSQDPIMSHYKEYGFRDVIAKPFSSIELGQKIYKVIQGKETTLGTGADVIPS